MKITCNKNKKIAYLITKNTIKKITKPLANPDKQKVWEQKNKLNKKSIIKLIYSICFVLLFCSIPLTYSYCIFSLFLLDLGRKSPYNEASQWEIASTMRKQQQQQQQQKTTKKTK
jgi:hypothetical protein